MDPFDDVIKRVEGVMKARRGPLPGDPLFIQVFTFNDEQWREAIVGTPFNTWMYYARTVWAIDRKGRIKCLKDIDEIYRNANPKPVYINELFETVEEMLTHDQAPIRTWGLFYKRHSYVGQ